MQSRKSLSAVVGMALLLVVAVVAAVSFQGWLSSYGNSLFASTETNSAALVSLNLRSLVGNTLYVDSEHPTQLNRLVLDGEECNIAMNLTEGLNKVDVGYCLNKINHSGNLDLIAETEDGHFFEQQIEVPEVCANRTFTRCSAIKESSCNRGDGTYLLETGDETSPVYCDMSEKGGGWMLALRGRGEKNTFRYDASYWTNNATLNPNQTYAPTTELKSPIFSEKNFSEILVVLETNGSRKSLVINKSSSSLQDLFNGPKNQTTNRGRENWTAILPAGGSLQENCNLEAVNAVGKPSTRARIGIIGNQENDCRTPDSSLGIGIKASGCESIKQVTMGNLNACDPLTSIASTGYLFIR